MYPTTWFLILTLVSTAQPARIERTVHAMGTELRIMVEATDRAAALAASEAGLRAIEAAEKRLSTWRGESELGRLNQSRVGEATSLSVALAADLEKARWCWQTTGGAFDPTVGSLVEAWGLRIGGRRPSTEELGSARAASGFSLVELTGRAAIRRRAGVTIEEGGFGKGAGLAAALTALASNRRVRSASFDFGGQAAVFGAPWTVRVADPRERGRAVVRLEIDHGSVATSGNSERGIEIDGEHRGHLLDPRTGRPAPDFGSLTVWTADPLVADCLSTGLYVLGPEAALAWAAERWGVEVLVLKPSVSGHLRARATRGWDGRLATLGKNPAEIEWFEPQNSQEEGSTASP